MKKIIDLLKTLGISEAEANLLIAASKDEANDFDIAPLITAATEHQKKIFENDPAHIERFKGEERGKQLDIISRELKKTFGLTSDEVKDKTVKEIIEFARTKSTSSSDQSVVQLQNDLLAANNRVKDYEENIIPGKIAEVDAHKKKISIENELTKLVSGKKLRVPFDAAFPSLVNHLSDKYDLDIDDKKQLTVFLKGTKLHPTKEDKTGLIGLGEILDAKFKEWQFTEESNGGKGPDTRTIGTPAADGEKKKMNFPGAEKALAAMEEIKSAPKD